MSVVHDCVWAVLLMLAFALCVVLVVATCVWRRCREMRTPDAAFAAPLPPTLDIGGVEAYLAARESADEPLKQGAHSVVRWAAGRRDVRAKLCVIFLHGWSAGVEEIDPVDANVAAAADAHLLRFRLTAHGLLPTKRGGEAMRDHAHSRALRSDAATAFALGRVLGERVLLIGCSTGGSLAMWAAAQPWAQEALAGLVLISPAWQVAKFGSHLYNVLKWPLLLAPRALAMAAVRGIVGPVIRGGTVRCADIAHTVPTHSPHPAPQLLTTPHRPHRPLHRPAPPTPHSPLHHPAPRMQCTSRREAPLGVSTRVDIRVPERVRHPSHRAFRLR